MKINETTDSSIGYSAWNIERVRKGRVKENYTNNKLTDYILSHCSQRLDLRTASWTALWVEPKKGFSKCQMLSAVRFIDEEIEAS